MIKKILLLLSILISVIGILDFYKTYKNPSYAESFGSLTVNFHSVLPGSAIFDIHNFLPGDMVSKTIDVKNDGDKTTEASVHGVKTDGSPDNPKIEEVLDLEIKQGSSTIYSGKLSAFFALNNVSLGTLAKNQSKSFVFTVTFPTSAGNEYQNKLVKFNLIFVSSGDVKGDHDDHHSDDEDDEHDDDNHNHRISSPKPTVTARPTPTPRVTPTPTQTPSPTPTPKHDDDHKHNFGDDIRDFGEKCKLAIHEVFKFGKH